MVVDNNYETLKTVISANTHNINFYEEIDQRQCSLAHKHRHINILKEQAKNWRYCFVLFWTMAMWMFIASE
jgi:hypothetical protein